MRAAEAMRAARWWREAVARARAMPLLGIGLNHVQPSAFTVVAFAEARHAEPSPIAWEHHCARQARWAKGLGIACPASASSY